MTIQQLRDKALSCKRLADKYAKTDQNRYHNLLQRAQALEAEAGEREYYKTSIAKLKESAYA
jgi:hypothetical protein